MTGMHRGLAMTLLLLAAANVAAAVAWPLVAAFALHHGEPGWQGQLYPAMTFGLVFASSLAIAGDRLSGRRGPWWAWLMLAAGLIVTGLMVYGQEAAR